MADETITRTGELADAIYKNVKMGSDLTLNLMPKVKDEKIKAEMSEQLGSYEKYAVQARKIINCTGDTPKEENAFNKFMAKMGITMNTMTDSTTSHIAEMMIQGSTMNVTDLLRKIHEAECENCGSKEIALARDIVEFEENNIEKLKRFL